MLTPQKTPHTSNLQHFDWRATDALQRDKDQSQRIHEPEYRIMTIDPITGHEVEDYTNHPSTLNSNMTIYFETEENRQEYLNMPFNHPYLHLPFPATDEDDRGG